MGQYPAPAWHNDYQRSVFTGSRSKVEAVSLLCSCAVAIIGLKIAETWFAPKAGNSLPGKPGVELTLGRIKVTDDELAVFIGSLS